MYRGMIRAEHGVVECLVIIRQTDRAAQIDLADIPESQRYCVRYVWTATHADARTHTRESWVGAGGWVAVLSIAAGCVTVPLTCSGTNPPCSRLAERYKIRSHHAGTRGFSLPPL